jgi:hypothetical protein
LASILLLKFCIQKGRRLNLRIKKYGALKTPNSREIEKIREAENRKKKEENLLRLSSLIKLFLVAVIKC